MRNYKIIDAFPFNGEFDMLRMRLDYLYNEVDFFFICESTVLQSGESKILTYESHSSSFEQYKDKIIYRVFEPNEVDIEFRKNVISYDSEDRFHLENKHRDFMREPLSEISDANTMIMLSDVDEFPRVELFDEIWNTVKDMDLDAVSCNMRTFYYSPLCELDINSYCTVIMNDFTLRNALRLSDVRNYTSTCKHFENGGWHLSFFHTPERIQKKIKSYSHSEFNTEDITNIDNIKFRMKNSLDVLCRKEIHIIKHDKIANDFPIEFYKHEIFTMNMNIDFDDKFRVLDTFVFGGELDMLEMRLDYLHDSVDYFIFCESTLSHSGQPKDLVYKANIDRFKKYENKIHYVVYDPDITDMKFIPNKEEDFNTDFWKLERGQRNKLLNKIIQLSDERTLILHSDLDEIPDRTKFYELRQMTKDLYMKVISLQQTTHYYAPNNILDITWYGTVAFNHKTLINIAQFWTVRENRYQCKHIDNAGWHFSFFFKPEDIQNKIKKYVHQEFNLPEITDIGTIRRKIFSGLDILNRDNVKIKRMDSINPNFPKEFYRYDFFFQNTFNREYLKPAQIFRKNISQQIRLEIENLQLAVSEHSPKVIVEIGTARGGTLCRWFEIPSATTIISIDKPLGIHGGTGFEERTYVISDAIEQANLSKKEFYAINGDSKDPYILNRLRELLHGRKIDFLFIDGDHTYEGVKNDFILYQEFLNNNAIVAFHDIIDSEFHTVHDCFVYHFWQELKQKYEFKEFIYTGLLDPVSNSHFYEAASNYGGFAGIGMIYYNSPTNDKKKITTDEANISLIVPIYNNVDNAINNTKITLSYSKHIDEIILYSNGTTEENNKKLQEFAKEDSRIRLEIVPNPIGFVKAVNNSIKLAKNNLILSLNSDAYLYFDWESRLLPFCLDEKYGLVGPILVRDFILGCCTIFKKDIINRIGMLDEGYDLGYEDDVEYSDRVKANGFKLGFCDAKRDFDWDSTTTFPIVHVQGQSFNTIVDKEKVSKMIEHNLSKSKSFAKCKDVIVLKEMQYEDILKILNENDNFIIVNKSGDNFEKIRYDERIIKLAKVLECTNDMDIDKIIDANTKGKHLTIYENSEISQRVSETLRKKQKLTWLAKFDDYSSMGILSQNIIKELSIDVSCQPIIGETETKNKFILDKIKEPINNKLGIMFSYPDTWSELNRFKTKVIYTGLDTTGGIPNFVNNIQNADFILTPSQKSKDKMLNLGVTKPIFIFPHGIDADIFEFKERNSYAIFKFLYVGECSDRKGIFQLLEAFISLFGNNSKVELHIKSNSDMFFYNGNDITKIKESHSNIHWYISNEGHDEVIKLYNSCHAYIYPSRADTFGMTLLEAMACGLPIISTDAPGATEIIKGRYYCIDSKLVTVKNHPWMLGEWVEPDVESLKKYMYDVYINYESIISSGTLRQNSDFIRQNFCWKNLVNNFELNILPKLEKNKRIITLVTSFNRSHHIENVIKSLKNIRESGVINDVYIVENSTDFNKSEIIDTIKRNIDENFRLYISEFNMGQRGALLQMLEDMDIDSYDYIQFSDQDNEFVEPLSTYCEILDENEDIFFVTGYMSKEHVELGTRHTKHGKLFEKRSMRAGHMFLSVAKFKTLLPIHLDSQYGQPHNSSWNAGLDWELTYWNKNAPGRTAEGNFILCVPGGVIHKGIDSTIYNWNVEENEYSIEELKELREYHESV